MSSEERNANDTLIKMITNLNPKLKTEVSKDFNFEPTPTKRRLSGSSDDDNPPKRAFLLTPENISCSKNNSFNSSYLASPREARRLRADLMEARNTIKDLENRIQHMHNVRKEMQIMFDNECKSLKLQSERDRKTIQELETQLQSIRKRESNVKEEITNLKNDYDLFKTDSELKINNLEKQLSECKTFSKCSEDDNYEKLMKLQVKNEELSVVLESAQHDVEVHKKLVSELEKERCSLSELRIELEKEKQAHLKVSLQYKEFEYIKESYAEFQQVTKAQLHKLNNYNLMEKENGQLKEENKRIKDAIRNKLLLEEEVHDLRNRLVKYKEQDQVLASLQATVVQNEMLLNEWKTLTRSICESSLPDSALPSLLRSTVEKLQQKEISLTSEIVQLQSGLNSAMHDRSLAQTELEKNQKHLKEVEKNLQKAQMIINRMQKRLQLVSRERDSYRLQLDSYERDLTVSSATSNPEQSQKDRIENLEKIIQGYRDIVVKLENDLQVTEKGPASDVAPIRLEQISRLQNEVDSLKVDKARLQERCDQLEIKMEEMCVGQDSNPGRILHLKKNPLSDALEEKEKVIERLQEDNKKLKRKVKKLEEGLEATKLANVSQDDEGLREKYVASENRNQQLKDLFKHKIQEFRNVAYMLLGYKIDPLMNSQYKLTSMYAERPDDQLCFQLSPEGNLSLLENHFSSSLEDMVDLHLRHQNSIPMFLSNVTIQLFSNRTATTTTVEID